MDLNIIINEVLKLAIMIAIFVLGRYVVPYIKSCKDISQFKVIYSWAETFVKAAENIIKESGAGEQKLELVTKMLSATMKKLNIKLSDDEIRAAIEEAVKLMNDGKADE